MGVFLNPTDEQRFFVRTLFNRELGREPTVDEQSARVQQLVGAGADVVLAELRDSAEAQEFRDKRGW